MRSKFYCIVILLVLLSGCRVESQTDKAPHTPGHRNVNYPSEGSFEFPEEQIIKDQFEVTKEWQTITFEKPLKINREGLMGLHLGVDQEPYISTMDEHPLNPECNEPECQLEAFCLRRLSDGVVIRPEVILMGDNGEEVKVRPSGHFYPYSDKTIRTIILGTGEDLNEFPPPFPDGITSFKSMRIRATENFWIRFLWWNVESHPDM